MDHLQDSSETTPLLEDRIGEAVDVRTPRENRPKQQRRTILLLYAFAFTMMLGDNLQPAALTQVFEAVICDEYYDKQQSLISITHNSSTPLEDDRCKAQPVQKELALIRGFQQLVPLIPALLCTIPYSILAERIGRRPVLILSGAGVLAAFSWVLAVCYLRFLSIRWILFSGIFLFIGGGDAVTSSLVHIMVTDAASEAERAQIFLNLHAADVLSGFFGPAISAALMEKGWTWSVLLLAQMMLFCGTFLISHFIPETLYLRQNRISQQIVASPSPDWESPDGIETPKRGVSRLPRLLASFLSTLTSNRQALWLLVIFAPQTAARELFTVLGLQYSRAKFSLPYARGNVLLSFSQAVQGFVVLGFFPMITRTIAEPRGWTPWNRDRGYAIGSITAMSLGLAAIGLAPALGIEVVGLLFVALGSCTTGFLMSLIGAAVRPDQVSTFYSAALTLSMMTRSVAGPAFSALLVTGLQLGRTWMGLPFLSMAIVMIGVTLASVFIRTEQESRDEDGEE